VGIGSADPVRSSAGLPYALQARRVQPRDRLAAFGGRLALSMPIMAIA
jgi:hypothetical protein